MLLLTFFSSAPYLVLTQRYDLQDSFLNKFGTRIHNQTSHMVGLRANTQPQGRYYHLLNYTPINYTTLYYVILHYTTVWILRYTSTKHLNISYTPINSKYPASLKTLNVQPNAF